MRLRVVEGDLRRPEDIQRAFREGDTIDAVIHFAGLKSVAESTAHPLAYWSVNVGGSCQLLQTMRDVGCRTLVFSSSATIYGHAATVPIPETAPIQPINPYGHTKVAVETMLADLHRSEPGWRVARLRYFNPVGAHPSGLLGEDPRAQPTNLFPLMLQVAFGDRERLEIFGSDWPTPDGTGIRDYIHVMDLAEAHRSSLELLLEEPPQLVTLNLGSGRGCSVLEMVSTLERTCDCRVPTDLADRREGDSAISIADCSEAWSRLGWRAKRSLEDICRDGFRWKRENPAGYDTVRPTRLPSAAPGAGT
jgi:UDP-glucose 4-epimerase